MNIIDILKRMRKSGGRERRRDLRINVLKNAQYKIIGKGGETKPGIIKDISAGGCRILVNEKLPLKARMELDIVLGETDLKSLRTEGKVVRLQASMKNWYEYGIIFDTLSEESRKVFADFCSARIREIANP